ncbi:MAG: AEC family transporter [Hungatella sp.]|nr:AEC family transporter [Hungatella sp.]
MAAVLSRAACFIGIIILGYGLRRIGFFKEEDFHVLSKIVLKITLPAAIVFSFADKEINPSMLIISLLGLSGGLVYIAAGFLMNVRASRERKAFEILNMSGYNIGNFTLPFVQSFLGPSGVVVTSLFDTGNAVVCLGGAYSAASMVKGESKGVPVVQIVKTLAKSVPFDTYLIMTILCLLGIRLPAQAVSFAGIIADGNAFMAMLMIGVGFKLSGDRSQTGTIIRILAVRYGIAAVLSAVFYFLLPMPLEYRQTLAILVFAPIASAAPAFTADLKGDIGLSSAVNSISILISICCIVGVVGVIL